MRALSGGGRGIHTHRTPGLVRAKLLPPTEDLPSVSSRGPSSLLPWWGLGFRGGVGLRTPLRLQHMLPAPDRLPRWGQPPSGHYWRVVTTLQGAPHRLLGTPFPKIPLIFGLFGWPFPSLSHFSVGGGSGLWATIQPWFTHCLGLPAGGRQRGCLSGTGTPSIGPPHPSSTPSSGASPSGTPGLGPAPTAFPPWAPRSGATLSSGSQGSPRDFPPIARSRVAPPPAPCALRGEGCWTGVRGSRRDPPPATPPRFGSGPSSRTPPETLFHPLPSPPVPPAIGGSVTPHPSLPSWASPPSPRVSLRWGNGWPSRSPSTLPGSYPPTLGGNLGPPFGGVWATRRLASTQGGGDGTGPTRLSCSWAFSGSRPGGSPPPSAPPSGGTVHSLPGPGFLPPGAGPSVDRARERLFSFHPALGEGSTPPPTYSGLSHLWGSWGDRVHRWSTAGHGT